VTRLRWTRRRVLLAAALVLLASVGVGIVSRRPETAGKMAASAPPPNPQGSLVATAAPSDAISAGPSATSERYVLDEPWLAFRVTAAVMVDGAVTAETDLEGWLAGTSDRWFDIESPGQALPIARVARLGGTVVAQAADGSWSASPRQIYDPWPMLDAAHVLSNGALDCASRVVSLDADTLRTLLSPLSLPAELQGFLAVESTGAATSECRMTTVATWTSGKTNVQWSRDLVVSPVTAATPWPGALQAAGVGPAPPQSSAAPTAGASGSAGSAGSGGSGFSMRIIGEAVYDSSTLGMGGSRVEITGKDAHWEPATSMLSLTVSASIDAQGQNILGFVADNLAYNVAPVDLVIDGNEIQMPGGVQSCRFTQRHGESVINDCVMELPLPQAPVDSVRLLVGIYMGESSTAGASGWLTLVPQP
jgi:hypothetical protein